MFSRISDVMDRQLRDHLTDGKFSNPSPDLLAQSHSCSATNISGEQVFGKVDSSLKHAANITVQKVEPKTMFGTNVISTWLSAKHPAHKAEFIRVARRQGATIQQVEKDQRKEFATQLQEKLRVKRRKLAEKKERQQEVTERLINVIHTGLRMCASAGKSLLQQKSTL